MYSNYIVSVIQANITGGGLVVCVEARPAPAGEYASPLQLRLMTRGSQDPADVVSTDTRNITGGARRAAGLFCRSKFSERLH